MEREVIISRLLDKYEKSKHLLEPGISNRRVMLRIEKRELPEYKFEEALIRDGFNQAVQELEQEGLVFTEWVIGRPVLSAVILNLECVGLCYQAIGRVHPKEQAEIVLHMVQDALGRVAEPWIIAWREDVCANAERTCAVPHYCKKDTVFLSQLLAAMKYYDSLHGEPITMRTFSSKCYQNSKQFEREIRETFLHIAEKYHSGLAEVCEHEPLGIRDKLASLGIYARPELYELSGKCTLVTKVGTIDVGATYPYGIALPSTAVNAVTKIELNGIHEVVFIENKTNYDEYLLSELESTILAVYHGGFLSPQKRKMFSKIANAITEDVQTFFWADIDLGGFQMFSHLQELIPNLQPMRMTGEDVAAHCKDGLKRPKEYLERLKRAYLNHTYPLFDDAIRETLHYGVTIEQEVFLVCN